MSNDVVLFNADAPAQLPAHLQGAQLNVSSALLATIGAGGNRIGLKGSRFRLVVNGKEERIFEENHLDVIVVGAVPHVSRMYYAGAYNAEEKAAPKCYSADGIAPPVDLETKEHSKCDTCPQNQKGSKVIDGNKIKACAYFQRLVVMLAGDDSGTLYKLDVKAQGLFGDSKTAVNKLNLREYTKFITNRGADVAQLVTRISFDVDSSVPKLLFHPFRYISETEYTIIKDKIGSNEVTDLLKISMATIDLSNEVAADEIPAGAEDATPAGSVEKATKPAAAEKPKETAKPETAAPTAEPAKKKYLPVPEKLGEFTVQQYLDQGWSKEDLIEGGYIVEVKPEPPAPPAKAAVPAAPPKKAPPAPPTKPAAAADSKPVIESVALPTAASAPAAKPAAAATAVVETSSDSELEAILAELT